MNFVSTLSASVKNHEDEEEHRQCTTCDKKMHMGYVINDGDEYFCDDDCLHAYYSEQEYDELCQQDAAYWTQWE